jgi:hypothetical protein
VVEAVTAGVVVVAVTAGVVVVAVTAGVVVVAVTAGVVVVAVTASVLAAGFFLFAVAAETTGATAAVVSTTSIILDLLSLDILLYYTNAISF